MCIVWVCMDTFLPEVDVVVNLSRRAARRNLERTTPQSLGRGQLGKVMTESVGKPSSHVSKGPCSYMVYTWALK